MRPRVVLAIALAASLLATLLLSHVPAVAQKASEPTVVAEDPAGDWEFQDQTFGPGGGPLSADLTEASIGMADATTVNFILKLASLPPTAGTPEITRYIWDFTVNGQLYELDGKFTNYSRGICDPTSGQCPPPRDPGMRPFFVRGNCRTENSVQVCDELAIIEATFDTAAATITIPVTLEQLQAKPGSVIGIGQTESGAGYGGSIVATFSAFFSSANMPHDDMVMTKTFTIPGGKKPKKTKGKRSPASTASPQSPSPTST